MSSVPLKLVFMMTVENIHGREILTWLLNHPFQITSIIIEHKSKRSERIIHIVKALNNRIV